MPSPIGHAIAGAAIAWLAESRQVPDTGPRTWHQPRGLAPSAAPGSALSFVCAVVAMAPDLDLLMPYPHRTVTHSVLAVIVVAIIAIVVTGKVTRGPRWIVASAVTAAFASHLLLDWLGADDSVPRGVQLLWPFGQQWFISGLDLFRGTARRDLFTLNSMRANALAVVQEVAILAPLAAMAWSVRVKALARFATELPGRHHAAQ